MNSRDTDSLPRDLTFEERCKELGKDSKKTERIIVKGFWKPSELAEAIKKQIPEIEYKVKKEKLDEEKEEWTFEADFGDGSKIREVVNFHRPDSFMGVMCVVTVSYGKQMVVEYNTKDKHSAGFFLASTKELFGF